jgi:hypothetical protein
MPDIRFIRKDGESVAVTIVRNRFFEAIADRGINLLYANRIWHDAQATQCSRHKKNGPPSREGRSCEG